MSDRKLTAHEIIRIMSGHTNSKLWPSIERIVVESDSIAPYVVYERESR